MPEPIVALLGATHALVRSPEAERPLPPPAPCSLDAPGRSDTPEAASCRSFFTRLGGVAGGDARAACALSLLAPPASPAPSIHAASPAAADAVARSLGHAPPPPLLANGREPLLHAPPPPPPQPLSSSSPLLLLGALDSWPRPLPTLERLAARWPGEVVVANDRAPARRADAKPPSSRAQATVVTTLRSYAEYVASSAQRSRRGEGGAAAAPPFYLNGWRAFAAHSSELVPSCPTPPPLAAVDHTIDALLALHGSLGALAGARGGSVSGGEGESGSGSCGGGDAPAAVAWATSVDRSLWKLFCGPPGTVTRCHVDAGDAHGWLAQTSGSKLFILFPPSSAEIMRSLDGEPETEQSSFDPLQGEREADAVEPGRWRAVMETAFVCVAGAGDAVLIPSGWWHFAVALEASTTVQRNFYGEGNVEGLVKLMLRSLKPKG